MAYISPSASSKPPLYKIDKFRGLNTMDADTTLDYNESPEMLNMFLDEKNSLKKRYGYESVLTTALGTGKVNGLFRYNILGSPTPQFLMAYGTKLYKLTPNPLAKVTPTEIYTGLANAPVSFFTMNNKVYIVDAVNYFVYDGTTVTPVTAYTPTVMISTDPITGVGTQYEDFNMLSKYFKQTFSGDNTTKIYPLILKGLDATLPTVLVNGVSTTAFTFDATNGIVTFTNAPSKGTNNVEITASKTGIDTPNIIRNCRYAKTFGGDGDSRVFMSGNPNYPNFMYRSGLFDPTYFPTNGYYQIGTPDDAITGFARQYSYLIVFKQRSIWNVEYHLDDTTGLATFPIKQINDQVGCIAPLSIQIIDNAPVFLAETGVYTLNQTNLKDERNVAVVSTRIENRLLFEQNLENAVAIDYDQKYYLTINGFAYVYDYRQEEWYLYDNFPIDQFLEYGNNLYFGFKGQVYRYKDNQTEPKPYNDDGVAISAYWKSKVISFESDEQLKFIKKIYYSLMPSTSTSCELWYTTNKKNRRFFKEVRFATFGYNTWNYSTFTYGSVLFPQEAVNKVKIKKIIYFQMELRNDNLDETLEVLSIGIDFLYQRYVK